MNAVDDGFYLGGDYRLDGLRTKPGDTGAMIGIARSRVWRALHHEEKVPVFLTLHEREQFGAQKFLEPFQVITTADLFRELRSLSLERKALLTLENLRLAEEVPGQGVEVPYNLGLYPGKPTWSTPKENREYGVTYGCHDREAPLVYFLLEGRGFITFRQVADDRLSVFLTPNGYSESDRLARGRELDIVTGFMVCRYDAEFDPIFETAFRPAGRRLNCEILRMKDIHHVDRIDDRICAELQRSTIVLVDLTDQNNFNVAFEAGYALALGKPIVWTARRTGDGVRLPFDIYTHNCLEWDAADLGTFGSALTARIQAAIDKAGAVPHLL
jgi:hypothetical protein